MWLCQGVEWHGIRKVTLRTRVSGRRSCRFSMRRIATAPGWKPLPKMKNMTRFERTRKAMSSFRWRRMVDRERAAQAMISGFAGNKKRISLCGVKVLRRIIPLKRRTT